MEMPSASMETQKRNSFKDVTTRQAPLSLERFDLFPNVQKDKKKRRRNEVGEVEGLGMLYLLDIPPVDPTSYLLFPCNGRGVLWLRMKMNVA